MPDRALRRRVQAPWPDLTLQVQTPPMPDRALRQTGDGHEYQTDDHVQTPPMPDRALRRIQIPPALPALVQFVQTPPMPDRALRPVSGTEQEYLSLRPNASNARQGIKTNLHSDNALLFPGFPVQTPPMPDRALRRTFPPWCRGTWWRCVQTPPMPDRALRPMAQQ